MSLGEDRPVAGDEIVLLEPISPQGYREWWMAYCGFRSVENLPAPIRARIGSPEEELKSLLDWMVPGDELWLARSRSFNQAALLGNKGIAIVRNGKPVWYRIGIQH